MVGGVNHETDVHDGKTGPQVAAHIQSLLGKTPQPLSVIEDIKALQKLTGQPVCCRTLLYKTKKGLFGADLVIESLKRFPHFLISLFPFKFVGYLGDKIFIHVVSSF